MSKIILKITNSPYSGDITKFDNLTLFELDSNLIKLKGCDLKNFYTRTVNNTEEVVFEFNDGKEEVIELTEKMLLGLQGIQGSTGIIGEPGINTGDAGNTGTKGPIGLSP